MLIHHTGQLLNENYQNDIKQLLFKYDKSFIPALSSRESTTQADLTHNDASDNSSSSNGIDEYFNTLIRESFIFAVKNDQVVAFMSFVNNKKIDYGSKKLGNYVSTVIVDESARGKGLTQSFYQTLLMKEKNITTRTWSTNFAHIKILNKMGFNEVKRIKNDRALNIYTVYYEKIVD